MFIIHCTSLTQFSFDHTAGLLCAYFILLDSVIYGMVSLYILTLWYYRVHSNYCLNFKWCYRYSIIYNIIAYNNVALLVMKKKKKTIELSCFSIGIVFGAYSAVASSDVRVSSESLTIGHSGESKNHRSDYCGSIWLAGRHVVGRYARRSYSIHWS